MKKQKEVKDEIIVIDFGCGQNKSTPQSLFDHALIAKEDIDKVKVIGVDIAKCEGVDKVFDLTTFPYPFKSDSIHAIFSSHFIEHLNGEDRVRFMDECYRILKIGGRMRLLHPNNWSDRAFQDPYHKSFINGNSYWYFDKNWRSANKLDHYPIKCDFEFKIYPQWQSPVWGNKNDESQMFAASHYINTVADLVVDLTKR